MRPLLFLFIFSNDNYLATKIIPTSTVESIIIQNECDVSPEKESDQVQFDIVHQSPKHLVGTLGWWIGPLEDKRVGIVIDDDTLKLYDSCRYGYVPMATHEVLLEWDLLETIDEYEFIERRSGIFLRF